MKNTYTIWWKIFQFSLNFPPKIFDWVYKSIAYFNPRVYLDKANKTRFNDLF